MKDAELSRWHPRPERRGFTLLGDKKTIFSITLNITINNGSHMNRFFLPA